jgi:hypothetical protein
MSGTLYEVDFILAGDIMRLAALLHDTCSFLVDGDM